MRFQDYSNRITCHWKVKKEKYINKNKKEDKQIYLLIYYTCYKKEFARKTESNINKINECSLNRNCNSIKGTLPASGIEFSIFVFHEKFYYRFFSTVFVCFTGMEESSLANVVLLSFMGVLLLPKISVILGCFKPVNFHVLLSA